METEALPRQTTDATQWPEGAHEDRSAMVERAVRFLHEHDRPEGWTAHELAKELGDELGLSHWKRISDARERGYAAWVVQHGQIVKRPGSSKTLQGATRITQAGRDLVTGGTGEPVSNEDPFELFPLG